MTTTSESVPGPVLLSVTGEAFTGISVELDGKVYEFSDPCDADGSDSRSNDGSDVKGFKIVETSYKGREEGETIDLIKEVARHPKVCYWNGTDSDGDRVWRAWVLAEDCDNYREGVRKIGEVQLQKEEAKLARKREIAGKVRLHRLDPKGAFDRSPPYDTLPYGEREIRRTHQWDKRHSLSDADLVALLLLDDEPIPSDMTVITTGEFAGHFSLTKPEKLQARLTVFVDAAHEKFLEQVRTGKTSPDTRYMSREEYLKAHGEIWDKRRA